MWLKHSCLLDYCLCWHDACLDIFNKKSPSDDLKLYICLAQGKFVLPEPITFQRLIH